MVMENLQCQKRRHIIIRNKDGSRQKMHRCANGASKNYKNKIDEIVCKSCTLRQPLLKLASTCKECASHSAVWPEPSYYNMDIVYPPQDKVDPPPLPEGYKRKDTWQFECNWGKCLYRQFMNQRSPKGNLQIQAFCTAQKNRAISYTECEKCLLDTTKISGNIPTLPGAAKLLGTYWEAVKRWISAGRPVREDAEVQKIHEEFCVSCSWHDSESQRCKGCGCIVKPAGAALFNKVKMKTERCPRNFW
jgi:hypothetical protein